MSLPSQAQAQAQAQGQAPVQAQGQAPAPDPRLSINQATIKHADLATALRVTTAAGVEAIGLWREPVNDVGLDVAARMLGDSGLRFSTHCRGGSSRCRTGRSGRRRWTTTAGRSRRPRRWPRPVPRGRPLCSSWSRAACPRGRAT